MGSFMKTLCFLVIGFSSLNFLRAESRLGGPTFVFRSTATQNGTMVYRFQSTQNPSGTVSSSSTNVCQEEIECKTCECSSSPKPSCRSICVETTSETRENNRTCTSNITCNSSGEPVESSPTCSCDDGYVDINGSCQLIPECSEGYVWDSTSSSCVPEPVCSPGSRQEESCGDNPNGTYLRSRTCNSDGKAWGAYGACAATSCNANAGYYLSEGQCIEQVCVPDTSESQSCYIENGSGTQSRTCNSDGSAWGAYGACAVTRCTNRYFKSGRRCILCRPNSSQSRACYIKNGEGTQSRTCNSRGLAWGAYGACAVTRCTHPYYQIGGRCIRCTPNSSQSRACYIENGSGTQSRTCNSRGSAWGAYGACAVTGCRPGYHRSGNSCVPNDVPGCKDRWWPVANSSECCSKSACQFRDSNSGWLCWDGRNGSYCD